MKNIIAVSISTLLLLCSSVNAQSPKPIEIVVPFSPGGTASVLGLTVAEMLTENNMPAIVVNKPGADSLIGANYAAKAAPDGKTLFLATTSSVVANVVFKPQGIEYDEKSFAPIVPLATTGMVLITPSSSPFKNYEQFKFYVKANPEKFNIGTFNSNLAKIWTDWAEREGLPKPNIIMYKGSSQMLTDVAGGHVLLAIDIWTSTIPFVKSGKVNVVATLDKNIQTNVKKLSPNSGSVNLSATHPELKFVTLYGIMAPADTPKPIKDQINAIINKSLKQPKYQATMESMDITEYGGTPESLATMQRQGINLLKKYISK